MFTVIQKTRQVRFSGIWISLLILLSLAVVGCQPAEDSVQTTAEEAVEIAAQSQEQATVERDEPNTLGDRDMPENAEWVPVIEDFDGVEMAKIPAGCFMMGDPELARAQPVHEVCISKSYWIDVTEVSNGQFERFGGQAARESGFPGQEISGDDLPRTSITWEEADEFCRLRGGRLPTEAEWEYAARGPDGNAYPWGSQFESSHLNFCEMNCPFSQNFGDVYATYNDGYDVAAPVYSMSQGASWVGALHMAGNVAEWVADWYDTDYYAESPVENPSGPESGSGHVVKSAPWSWYEDVEENFQVANRWDFIPDSTSRDYSGTTGFRCARGDS